MAGYTRLHTTNASVLLLANDIYDDQTFEIGEMQGWLDSWGLTRSTTLPTMGWMTGHSLDADGLMPGMATPAEISHLQSLTGNALDIDFLQLMIRHHQGGLQMEQYAADHAVEVVREGSGQQDAAGPVERDHFDGATAAPARRGTAAQPVLTVLQPGWTGESAPPRLLRSVPRER